MPGGLVALLDDIATLAKVAASSLDDVAAGAAKASAKAAGVVIDDAAVTPQYVQGLSPAREVPVIARIAKGSLINKLAIILPAALLLSWLAPWALPILLIIGGSYLCFEGAEKVLSKLGLISHHHEDNTGGQTTSASEFENKIVASAVRTDLILSAEIMLIALADLSTQSSTMRIAVLVTVAFAMTFVVYGAVALLVKMDDFGAHLARGGGARAGLGRSIVKMMPGVFSAIGIVGTVAMLWVGGHIIIASLADVGFGALHHGVEYVVHLVQAGGSAVMWLVETAASGVFGLVWGSILAGIWLLLVRLIRGATH